MLGKAGYQISGISAKRLQELLPMASNTGVTNGVYCFSLFCVYPFTNSNSKKIRPLFYTPSFPLRYHFLGYLLLHGINPI